MDNKSIMSISFPQYFDKVDNFQNNLLKYEKNLTPDTQGTGENVSRETFLQYSVGMKR